MMSTGTFQARTRGITTVQGCAVQQNKSYGDSKLGYSVYIYTVHNKQEMIMIPTKRQAMD